MIFAKVCLFCVVIDSSSHKILKYAIERDYHIFKVSRFCSTDIFHCYFSIQFEGNVDVFLL